MSYRRSTVAGVSLTSHLDDRDSPVHRWFADNLPDAAAIRPWRDRPGSIVPLAVPASAHVVWSPRAWPTRVSPTQDVHASTLGTAVDYRLRLLLAPDLTLTSTVAALGAFELDGWFRLRERALASAGGAVGAEPRLVRGPGYTPAFTELIGAVAHTVDGRPPRRLSSRSIEDRLASYCWLLALFEQVFRAGIHPAWPLAVAGPDAGLKDLLALVPAGAAREVTALTRVFIRTQPDLLACKRLRVGPVFAQSAALGGADADLLLDGLLLDVKVTVNPHLDRDRVWQLAGYALADTRDSLGIRSVGMYFARHGQLLAWPLRDYLSALAGRRIAVRALRREFAAMLEGA